MPTIFSHPAVPFGVAPWFRRLPLSLILLGAVVSSLPDADVGAFGLGIPYDHPLGHRGFTHSICFAVMFAAFAAFAYVRLRKARSPDSTPPEGAVRFRVVFAFFLVALLSHGLFDAMTAGGKGVGFFIPFSNRRFFLPYRPIRVSPIGAEDFAEKAGVVLASELEWVWLPWAVVGGVGLMRRRIAERRQQSGLAGRSPRPSSRQA